MRDKHEANNVLPMSSHSLELQELFADRLQSALLSVLTIPPGPQQPDIHRQIDDLLQLQAAILRCRNNTWPIDEARATDFDLFTPGKRLTAFEESLSTSTAFRIRRLRERGQSLRRLIQRLARVTEDTSDIYRRCLQSLFGREPSDRYGANGRPCSPPTLTFASEVPVPSARAG